MEKQHTIHGVPGRYWIIKNPGIRAAHCHDAQKWISEARPISGYGKGAMLRVEIRHDDSCGNGHNSFAITAEVFKPEARDIEAGGCLHDEIARVFPELAGLVKWHLCSTDEPMHYLANTLYWLGFQGFCDGKENSPPNLTYARSTAKWADLPDTFICPEILRDAKPGELFYSIKQEAINEVCAALRARLADLLAEFQRNIEAAGFEFTASELAEAAE